MSELIAEPTEVGTWMLECALSEWYGYDEGNLSHKWHADGSVTVKDSDFKVTKTIKPLTFFNKHKALIFNSGMMDIENGAHHSWWNWASKSNGASADDYDGYTTDFILQLFLYGKIVYS